MRSVFRRVAASLVGVALLAVLGGGAVASTPSWGVASLDLTPYRGKVVYLDFWASWCGPCKLSFPFMNRLAAYDSGRDFVLLAVNVDHDRAKADAFLAQVGGHVPVVYDSGGALARRFGVKAMPTSILIGRDGRIRYVHTGFYPEKMTLYQAHITELLNEN
jgi:cytochrome c biogenesis protein CcmG, thiol:disulfide interchange protein DsbE